MIKDEYSPLILIVDDIPQNLQVLASIIRKAGYRIALSQSGVQTLEFVKTKKPDLILLDIMMPEMDGIEVCRRLKADSTTRDIPVIFITALEEISKKVLAFEIGGVDYVTKPFAEQEVLARINVIIERATMMKAIEAQKNQYMRLFMNAPAPILIVSEYGSIAAENQTWHDLYGSGEQNTDIREQGKFYQNLNEVMKDWSSGKPLKSFETELQARNGNILTYSVEVIEIDFENRKCLQLLFHDVTGFKEIDRLKTAFISMASHELRTPLTSIIGYAKTLKNYRDIDNTTFDEFVDVIISEGARLQKMVEDMLSLSHIESGKMVLDNRDFDMMMLLQQVCDAKQIAAGEKLQKLIIHPDDNENFLFYGDYDKLVQVMENLVANAIKFSPENGTIEINVIENESGLTVKVADNGPGVPADEIEKVFERFYRGRSGDSCVPGSGLGLSLAKEIVELHDGIISVSNRAGGGAEFTVELHKKRA